MRYLVVLCLTLASCLGDPSIGYSYSAYAPAVSYSSSNYQYHPILSPALYSSPISYSPAIIQHSISHAPLVHTVPVGTVVEGVKTQYHTQDTHGQANYGHSEPQQTHSAVQDVHGNKVGSFSYVKPDGQIHRTDYVADAQGYRVASNDLPVSPVTTNTQVPQIIVSKTPIHHPIYKRSIYSYNVVPSVVTPGGHIADTPEVTAAKAAHFAEHAKRGNYYGYSSPASVYTHHRSHDAPVVLLPNGHIADTPEVTAAKAAHFSEHAKRANYYNPHHAPWVTPVNAISYYESHPTVTEDGYVADTPEVSAAKAAHLAEHVAAAARASHDPESHPTRYDYAPYSSYPAAAPVITPSGHIADTPEVAHAKAAHLAEYAAVARRHKRSIFLGHTPASTVPLHAQILYPATTLSAHPLAYSLHHSIAKPVTHTTIVHGPHAVSYQVQ